MMRGKTNSKNICQSILPHQQSLFNTVTEKPMTMNHANQYKLHRRRRGGQLVSIVVTLAGCVFLRGQPFLLHSVAAAKSPSSTSSSNLFSGLTFRGLRNWRSRLSHRQRLSSSPPTSPSYQHPSTALQLPSDYKEGARKGGPGNEIVERAEDFVARDIDPSEEKHLGSSRAAASAASLHSIISAMVKNVVTDRSSLGRITVSTMQIGLVLYLAHSAWKALVEVLDECSQELSSNGMDASFLKANQVEAVISMCEENTDRPIAEGLHKNLPQIIGLPISLSILISRLMASGMALRSTPQHPTSIESVLRSLSRAEASLLLQCLWTPSNTTASYDLDTLHAMWTDVVGLHEVKERLLSALASLSGRNQAQNAFGPLFESGSLSGSTSPSGILLYGPPGCGKTRLVQALATTARLPCFVVTPSTLLRKYVGETNSQVRNLFSMLQKSAPCILCIDELDGLFRERSDTEHEVSRDLKTEFLQWWDGMLSNPSTSGLSPPVPSVAKQPILVIGASNRPFDVDPAVLRRLPQSHFIGLPNVSTRSYYLRKLLDQVPATVDVDQVAALTEGYSPSDLKHLLQAAAAMGPMKEASLRALKRAGDTDSTNTSPPRPLTTNDVVFALEHTPPTPMSHKYRAALQSFTSSSGTSASGTGLSAADRPGRGAMKWETDDGTFYHIGQLEVDSQSCDALSEMMRFMSQQEEHTVEEEEEDDSADLD